MAIKKTTKESPRIFIGTSEPNAAGIMPDKIGDLYINTALSTLHFGKAITGSYPWGTAGTA